MKSSELFQKFVESDVNKVLNQIEARHIDGKLMLVFYQSLKRNNTNKTWFMDVISNELGYCGQYSIEEENNSFVEKKYVIFAAPINVEIDKLALKEDIW